MSLDWKTLICCAAITATVLIGCTPRVGIDRPHEYNISTEVVKIVQVEDASGFHLFKYVELSNGCVVTIHHRNGAGQAIDCR